MKTNITGLSGNGFVYSAKESCKKHKGSIIVVPDTKSAERFKEDLSYFTSKDILVISEELGRGFIYEREDREGLYEKIKGASRLLNDEDIILIIPIIEALKKYPNPSDFKYMTEEIKVGEKYSPEKLRRKLQKIGYLNTPVTESFGEYSIRGDILDIFISGYEYPVRIEFFGDDIDSIRCYDPENQRSISSLDSVMITPALIFNPDEDEITRGIDNISNSKLPSRDKEKLIEIIETRSNERIYEEYIDYFDISTSYIFDYLNEDGVLILCDPSKLRDRIEEIYEGEHNSDLSLFLNLRADLEVYSSFDDGDKTLGKFDNIIKSSIKRMTSFNGMLNLLVKEIKKYQKKYFDIHIVAPRRQLEGIKKYIQDNEIYGNIIYDDSYLSSGLIDEERKICYITLNDIFPNFSYRSRAKKRSKKNNNFVFTNLRKGDYVVHEMHGIGIFEQIKTLETEGVERDYLEIHYAGEAILYIPVDNADLVQRYIGASDSKPKLSKISGKDWINTRKKARKAIETIAQDLIKLYAEREARQGYAFPEDSEWQKDFEADFPYEETEDQLKAIDEIKEDMQRTAPMDRLLCGDVGYGKTEVAARAIFKCVSDGKQAVLLAPTTLLVNQHYENLKERFGKFPFEIEMLSRFKSETEQKEIIKKLKAGTIDFVVGTHRLLSNDIEFKDLGLLVIDEEQRFGVKSKEKIKGMKKNVDILTLSATPIPRTLNMSLTGIKNISTIEEPPQDRYPVQTYVSEENDEIIKRALEREISSGGQAFIIYNRVNGIYRILEKIEKLAPSAKIAVGHGRMDEKRLEDVMKSFIEGRYDILLATTIIENGIDIPNANTIIILNAENLGMAQLYQLRGRVGRSNKLAYAYLMHKPDKILTDEARKRLTAIKEFTELGSGFKLAMRDLEIRGGGNMLGEAQSGHVAGIGYELYCKEIDRAVKKLKGDKGEDIRSEVEIDLKVPYRIPTKYIKDESLRLEAYKKIAEIDSTDDSMNIIDELIDRFGEIPVMTINLINISEIKSHSRKLGIKKISSHMINSRINKVELEILNSKSIDPYSLILAKEKYKERLIIKSGKKTILILKMEEERKTQDTLNLIRMLKRVDI